MTGIPLDRSRLGSAVAVADPPGVRVILDVRPLQGPERAPITAIYLRELLAAFARRPIEGESFVLLQEAGATEPGIPDGRSPAAACCLAPGCCDPGR